jgi:hypothetical protein
VAVTAEDVWSAYARLERLVDAAAEAHGGDGWFALLSREANCALNVCGLTSAAMPASAAALPARPGGRRSRARSSGRPRRGHLDAACGLAVLDEARGHARGADGGMLEAPGQPPPA